MWSTGGIILYGSRIWRDSYSNGSIVAMNLAIRLDNLEATAKYRPADYVEDVLSHAVEITETHYILTRDDFDMLRSKYQANRNRSQWGKAAERIGHGAAGLLKSAIGIDRAADEIIGSRLEICGGCPENQPCVAGRCCGRLFDVLKPSSRTCGCVIANKVKLAGESCPMSRW